MLIFRISFVYSRDLLTVREPFVLCGLEFLCSFPPFSTLPLCYWVPSFPFTYTLVRTWSRLIKASRLSSGLRMCTWICTHRRNICHHFLNFKRTYFFSVFISLFLKLLYRNVNDQAPFSRDLVFFRGLLERLRPFFKQHDRTPVRELNLRCQFAGLWRATF